MYGNDPLRAKAERFPNTKYQLRAVASQAAARLEWGVGLRLALWPCRLVRTTSCFFAQAILRAASWRRASSSHCGSTRPASSSDAPAATRKGASVRLLSICLGRHEAADRGVAQPSWGEFAGRERWSLLAPFFDDAAGETCPYWAGSAHDKPDLGEYRTRPRLKAPTLRSGSPFERPSRRSTIAP